MQQSRSFTDVRRYLLGYPDQSDNLELDANLKFYSNLIKSEPNGDYIDVIHTEWYGNYSKLEQHHGYIQWLFPIKEYGMNPRAQPLQPHEAREMSSKPHLQERVLMSYQMMLDFYGMQVQDEKTGTIIHNPNWRTRFQHLNQSYHNYLRITRILKCLGEVGFEHYKLPFLQFIAAEILAGHLRGCLRSAKDYWFPLLRSQSDRATLENFVVKQPQMEKLEEQQNISQRRSSMLLRIDARNLKRRLGGFANVYGKKSYVYKSFKCICHDPNGVDFRKSPRLTDITTGVIKPGTVVRATMLNNYWLRIPSGKFLPILMHGKQLFMPMKNKNNTCLDNGHVTKVNQPNLTRDGRTNGSKKRKQVEEVSAKEEKESNGLQEKKEKESNSLQNKQEKESNDLSKKNKEGIISKIKRPCLHYPGITNGSKKNTNDESPGIEEEKNKVPSQINSKNRNEAGIEKSSSTCDDDISNDKDITQFLEQRKPDKENKRNGHSS